jgi:hypothetical protein
VWSAFLCARHDLMLEVHRLRASRQEHVQDAVAALSSMLRNFSQDVLCLQHMRSAAAAAVAPSAPPGLTQSTDCTQTREMHGKLKADCSSPLVGRNRSRMSGLHACGIMHAVEHMNAVHATPPTAGGIAETCPQLPDIEAGEVGTGKSSQVQAESGCAVKCTEARVACMGIRDPPAAPLPKTLPPNQLQLGPTWHEVCTKSSRCVISSGLCLFIASATMWWRAV